MTTNEFNRLQTLLPEELLSKVKIISATKDKKKPIYTSKLTDNTYTIEIDSSDWKRLDIDSRNLLFWHEVARIQQYSVGSYNWESAVFGIGLCMSAMEVTSQHIWLLSVYLLLTLVAGWQLYQNRLGESYMRIVTQGDRGAMLLAQQFGYSLQEAYASLHGAIEMLLKRSPQSSIAKQYKTRLQVLEIWASDRRKEDPILQ